MQRRTKGLIIALGLAGAIAVSISSDAVCDAQRGTADAVIDALIKCHVAPPGT